MSDYTQAVLAALRNMAGWEDVTAAECDMTRQGGLTNIVYLVHARGQGMIVRIPGDGTHEYIDRAVEITNARAAHAAGVSAEVLWAEAASGIMISRAIGGITTMTPDTFSTRAGAAHRAGEALAKLHTSGESFDFRFELFTMIDDYLRILSTKNAELPDGYHDIVKAAGPIKEALEVHPATLAPCHCDPLCENFLDDGARMWIVDWEYSGMNDPLWDVGDLSVEAGMSEAEEADLMHGYFGGAPSPAQHGRVVIYKAMCDLLWTLWGLIQHADNNPADDFWAYATGRFDRCKALMNDPTFEAHVKAVRKG